MKLDFSALSVRGGEAIVGTVAMDSPVPPGYVVSLTSDAVVTASTPDHVMIPPNTSAQTFAIQTRPVAADSCVTITAVSPSGETVSGTISVTPPVVTALKLLGPFMTSRDATDAGLLGVVTLDAPAPHGFAVALSTSTPPFMVAGAATALASPTRLLFWFLPGTVIVPTITATTPAGASYSATIDMAANMSFWPH